MSEYELLYTRLKEQIIDATEQLDAQGEKGDLILSRRIKAILDDMVFELGKAAVEENKTDESAVEKFLEVKSLYEIYAERLREEQRKRTIWYKLKEKAKNCVKTSKRS